jgi:predicted DNA-binding transcriptional regulator YafY
MRIAPDAIEDVTAYWESDALGDTAAAANRGGRRGWKIYRLLFPGLDVAVAHVMMWGDRVEAIDPPEVRATVVARATDALRRYRSGRSRAGD